jgi:hypothetical protein
MVNMAKEQLRDMKAEGIGGVLRVIRKDKGFGACPGLLSATTMRSLIMKTMIKLQRQAYVEFGTPFCVQMVNLIQLDSRISDERVNSITRQSNSRNGLSYAEDAGECQMTQMHEHYVSFHYLEFLTYATYRR